MKWARKMKNTLIEKKKLVDRINAAIDFTLESQLHDTIYLFNLIEDKEKCNWESILYFLELTDKILFERKMDKIIFIDSRFYLDETIDEYLDLLTLSQEEFDNIVLNHIDLDSFRIYFDLLEIQKEYGKKAGKMPGLTDKEINNLFPHIDKNKFRLIFRHIPVTENDDMDQSIYLTSTNTIKMFK